MVELRRRGWSYEQIGPQNALRALGAVVEPSHDVDALDELLVGDINIGDRVIRALIAAEPAASLEIIREVRCGRWCWSTWRPVSPGAGDAVHDWSGTAPESPCGSLSELVVTDLWTAVRPVREELLARLRATGVRPSADLGAKISAEERARDREEFVA